MKGAKYVLIAGLALIAAEKIADSVQKKQDGKKGIATTAISQNTTSKAIANAKPLTGPDPPKLKGDRTKAGLIAKQYMKDMILLIDGNDFDSAAKLANAINEITHSYVDKYGGEDVRSILKGYAADTGYVITELDSAGYFIKREYMENPEGREKYFLIEKAVMGDISGMMAAQIEALKNLKKMNLRQAGACEKFMKRHGKFEPNGIGIGISGMLQFYREQISDIDKALENTGKALEQTKRGEMTEIDWLVTFDKSLIFAKGEVSVLSVCF